MIIRAIYEYLKSLGIDVCLMDCQKLVEFLKFNDWDAITPKCKDCGHYNDAEWLPNRETRSIGKCWSNCKHRAIIIPYRPYFTPKDSNQQKDGNQ